MQVYKFGGASIATPERMAALLPIIQEATQPIIMVVSALGKTTNALEDIVSAACKGDKEKAHDMARKLEQIHLDYAKTLLNTENFAKAEKALNVFFTELQWAIDDAEAAKYDYSYDQIVCMGELLSTRIFGFYLQQEGLNFEWADVRDVVRTDETFRDARVDWNYSETQAKQKLGTLLSQGKSIVTQGFIGATADNASVTLGREGSDYTAAMLAAMLGATGVTIWKDVEGLQNADPKLFPNTVKIEAITYHEVIEMAYYGAQVIHPKTIKPLQNNGIPLYVRCFLNKDLKGTVIQNEVNSIFYPPLIVLKQKQILLQVTTRDFSFVTEDNLSNLYSIFHKLKIKVNLIQNAAISFVACIDHKEDQIQALVTELEKDYKVFRNEDVSLLTIRHYTPEILFEMTKGKYTLLEQKTRQTVQVVMK
ncbi:aspartate kinase [Taibaiella soli]|uniref:Aspartokinase n=1 Tax=Taibaiella soli TaxID=1649169 RepID=A0A2W2ADH3_9BACT|nr:aspartate kinase [Taibaiella soli]PZF73301.1 aspartate kinase [Taibaiella soli]